MSLLILSGILWGILTGMFFAVTSLMFIFVPSNSIMPNQSFTQSSSKFELASLSVPICGVFVLNQLTILYLMGDYNSTSNVIEVSGIQWFWTMSGMDSVLTTDFMLGDMVGVLTSSCAVINLFTVCSLYFTAIDVIHAFYILVIGHKLDCIPGRVAEATMSSNFSGFSSGQCSELCGTLHGFMPSNIIII